MFAVNFMEKLAALSADTKLEPMANLLTDTICYIVNSPRLRMENDTYPPANFCNMIWSAAKRKYVTNYYLPVCDKV
jgi:hypothetical protein